MEIPELPKVHEKLADVLNDQITYAELKVHNKIVTEKPEIVFPVTKFLQ